MLPPVLATNWTEWAAIGSLAAAVGTLALAGTTVWLASRTHDVATKTEGVAEKTEAVADKTGALAEQTAALVEKTAGLVGASLREAQATEALALEAKTDRQLAWRPQLELLSYFHVDDVWDFEIRNSGPGPAFQVAVLAREIQNIGRWTLVRVGDLRPGDTRQHQGKMRTSGFALTSPFENIPGALQDEIATWVLMCSDVLGRRHRFPRTESVNKTPGSMYLKLMSPEMSVLTDDHPDHTGWAAEPLIWG